MCFHRSKHKQRYTLLGRVGNIRASTDGRIVRSEKLGCAWECLEGMWCKL